MLPTRGSNVIQQLDAYDQRLAWMRERAAQVKAAAKVDACSDESSALPNPPSRAIARLQKKSLEAAIQVEKKLAETPQQLFLPGFEIGAFPIA